MNTTELNARYSMFLESCCMCDSSKTKIISINRESQGDLKFTYQQLGIECQECGFNFTNNKLSATTLQNRSDAERLAKLRKSEELRKSEVYKLFTYDEDVVVDRMGYRHVREIYDYKSISSSFSKHKKTLISNPGRKEIIARFFPVRNNLYGII